MKAIVYMKFGPPEVLQLKEVEKPTPKNNEILIKIHATPVNFGDTLVRNFNAISPRKFHMPFLFWLMGKIYFGFRKPKITILGSEFSGIDMLGVQSSSLVLLLLIMAICGLGIGVVAPAANNACIELMPHRISTITGIRSMFRQAGSVVSITIGSLLLHNLGMAPGFYIFFLGLAVATIVIMCPLIFAMPKSIGISPGESGVSIQ